MLDRPSSTDADTWSGPGIREFIALMAAVMASNALAVDSMLPALPTIGEALGEPTGNQRQLVVTIFMLGFGAAQLVYGPLADRFGRKPVLIGGLTAYAGFSLLAAAATSFPLLLGARLFQGVASASTRVLVVSIVRDRFHGELMARTMSFTFIVFTIVPVIAPTLGQAILLFAGWREIFLFLALYAMILLAWSWLRLPETLVPENRRPLSLAKMHEAWVLTLTHRQSIGNTIASALVMGALLTFVNSVQQIVFDVFGRPDLIGIVFASVAGTMAVTAYLNTTLVMRLGSRPILIAGLASMVVLAMLHLLLSLWLGETLLTFVLLQAPTMACLGLILSNLNAIAMRPMGHIAGTAASVQGTIATVGGALIGLLGGQMFNGTTLPLLLSFSLCGALALAIALWANRPIHSVAESPEVLPVT